MLRRRQYSPRFTVAAAAPDTAPAREFFTFTFCLIHVSPSPPPPFCQRLPGALLCEVDTRHLLASAPPGQPVTAAMSPLPIYAPPLCC